MSDYEYTRETRTGELRWSRSGRLEECWRVETYGPSHRQYCALDELRNTQRDWRLVPTEADE